MKQIDVKVIMYDGSKYMNNTTKIGELVYRNIVRYEVVTGEQAEVMEKDFDVVDIFQEYLVIHLQDGNTATFFNTTSDLFLI